MRVDRPRRGAAGAAALLAALILVCAAGCGGGGGDSGSTVAVEKEADGQVLNAAISRELTLVAGYSRGLRSPAAAAHRVAARRRRSSLLREFRAHAQEHIDALTKAMRGLGQAVQAEAEPIDNAGGRSWRKLLRFLYQLETRAIRAHLTEISKLFHPGPRSLLASIAAAEAQQLVVIRQELGAATPGESVPEAFESGSNEPNP